MSARSWIASKASAIAWSADLDDFLPKLALGARVNKSEKGKLTAFYRLLEGIGTIVIDWLLHVPSGT